MMARTLLLVTSLLMAACNDNAATADDAAAATKPERAIAAPASDPSAGAPSKTTTETATAPVAETASNASGETDLPALAEAGDGAAPASLAQYQNSLAKRCETDSDCVVKNVGNCCGYAPQCVHKDVQTFPEQVKALCEKEGRSSICGFQEPAGCACVDNQCRESDAALQ
ncbi:MAG TPA: hypothetical protein VFV64_08075 [Permianibacter sp.]|nr:hypothetical protein [Permianibacter sp.]